MEGFLTFGGCLPEKRCLNITLSVRKIRLILMLNYTKYSAKHVTWKAVRTDIYTLKTALHVAEDATESSVFGRTMCDTWVSYTHFSPYVLALGPRVWTTCPKPLHSGVLTSNQRRDLLITSPTPNTVVLLCEIQYTVGHKSETTSSWS